MASLNSVSCPSSPCFVGRLLLWLRLNARNGSYGADIASSHFVAAKIGTKAAPEKLQVLPWL
jgi:hypothetical protein